MTIKTTQGGLKGAVNSGMKSCKKNRKVTVFKTKNDKKVGSTKANKRGNWSLDVNRLNGKYYAAVELKVSKQVNNNGVYLHLHICQADNSPNVKS